MNVRLRLTLWMSLPALLLATVSATATASELDKILARENAERGVTHEARPVVDDYAFLRRLTVDMLGRIPTNKEINEFRALPAETRREQLVAKLLEHPRFADRWTAFYADMLRIRANSPGGPRLQAWVHQAIEEDMPYDAMCRRLIEANGRPTSTPEAAFVLGDDADPLAMAAVTAQVFMGVRMSCAQCHDHPFDVWTRKQFYGLAAFYGKTRRVENDFTNSVYTTEGDEMAILWPPEGMADPSERKPVKPTFPFELIEGDRPSNYIQRLTKLRSLQKAEAARQAKARAEAADRQIDNLLETAGQLRDDGPLSAVKVNLEAKRDIRKIDINSALYRPSELRNELAEFVTSPRNRFFGRAIVNRVWAELIGRGFVEPIDDFRDDNPPSHPETLDYIVDEFVASGYSFKHLLRMIVTSDAYQRDHIPGVDEKRREEMEASFLATPMRRMRSEALYDSIVTAGHLFGVKHPQGENIKVRTVQTRVRVKVDEEGNETPAPTGLASITPEQGQQAMQGMAMQGQGKQLSGYDLEKAIELDFDSLLAAKSGAPQVDEMRVMSKEEIEAQQMMAKANQAKSEPGYKYVTKTVEQKYDDNPQYNSALRMASPAPAGHFLRVFGQPARDELGDLRDPTPSMRQALMIMNGRLTNEAARVGKLEMMHKLLEGERANLDHAVRLAYREILTREPTAAETAEAKEIITSAQSDLEGMADLRWVLLNSHEFRFLP